MTVEGRTTALKKDQNRRKIALVEWLKGQTIRRKERHRKELQMTERGKDRKRTSKSRRLR